MKAVKWGLVAVVVAAVAVGAWLLLRGHGADGYPWDEGTVACGPQTLDVRGWTENMLVRNARIEGGIFRIDVESADWAAWDKQAHGTGIGIIVAVQKLNGIWTIYALDGIRKGDWRQSYANTAAKIIDKNGQCWVCIAGGACRYAGYAFGEDIRSNFVLFNRGGGK